LGCRTHAPWMGNPLRVSIALSESDLESGVL
jgi:hypothetical protein